MTVYVVVFVKGSHLLFSIETNKGHYIEVQFEILTEG
jgi:hypothetical protein